jgi:molybdate transport system substrate-binding protein
LSTVSASAAEVRVFAAVSLTEALEEIAVAYEKKTGDDVVFHFGASSMLARQIEQGAPADLFLSADEAKMDALARQGLIVAATRASVLSNTLVIVVPKDGGMTITSPAQLVNVRSLALAEPSSVPAGVYARTWLQDIGLWERLAPKVVPTVNVRAALAAVESGNVDAAIVYKTDARIAKHTRVAYEVPRAQGPKISYPFALLRDAENRQAATRFLAYLKSKAALNIFAKHGFPEGRGQRAEGRSTKIPPSSLARWLGGRERKDLKLRKAWPVPRFAHFEILSLTHTRPPCAQNDGETSALCALRSAL